MTLVTAATEIGSGAIAQALPQIVAAELGISIDDVHVSAPDTSIGLFDGGAQGGRTTYMAGTATQKASVEMRDKILDIASGLLEADAGDLELRDGAAVVSGAPDRSVTLGKVARVGQAQGGPLVASGSHASAGPEYDTGCISGSVFGGFTGGSYHTHIAEVEVDPDTGQVTILRYIVAQDVGKALNPQAISAQVDGGVLQGIGYSLFEDLRLEDGVCLDWGFRELPASDGGRCARHRAGSRRGPGSGRRVRRQGCCRGADHPGRRSDRQRGCRCDWEAGEPYPANAVRDTRGNSGIGAVIA